VLASIVQGDADACNARQVYVHVLLVQHL